MTNSEWFIHMEYAEALAMKFHDGQTDMSGRPYTEHCAQVSDWCFTPEAKIIGLLHDIIEDTDCTYYDLVAAGLPPVVIQGVHDMTQQEVGSEREPLQTYWDRVKRNPYALEVKLADIRHNNDPARQAALPPERAARLRAKYERAIAHLLA